MELRSGTVLSRYLHGSMDLALYDLYGTSLSAFSQKTTLRVAVVGVDTSLFDNVEAIHDFGLTIKGYYAGNPADIFHPSKPIQDLQSSEYDLLIVGAMSLSEEIALLEKLGAHFSDHNQLSCPILLMRRLLTGVKGALEKTSRLETCLNFRKLSLIAHALLATYDGCILECGAFRGGTTVFMGKLLNEWGDTRKIYTCDTFEGMPIPTSSDQETIYQAGLFTETSLEGVSHYVQEQGLNQQVTLVKGLVQDTLPNVLLGEPQVSFALVDTDQYQGTLSSLKLIVPKLQTNGIVLVDDYNVEGVKNAVSEIREQYPQVGGAEVSMNFYMLWNRTNRYFLSSCQVC
ncbi:TylF/MycF/NovP-related O-methyltransferase [Nitrospira sp. M1]